MSLTIAVQMDPMESIAIAGDSSFALMLAAQARGHRLFHYAAQALSYEDGQVRAVARPISVRRGKMLAFVEVKQRATADAAAQSLDEYRLRRVAFAARQLAPRYARPGDDIRIDAIFIVPRRWPLHLVNVWLG